MLSGLQVAVLLDKIVEIVIAWELVGVRIWILGLDELGDGSGSDLEVLLQCIVNI